MDRINHSTATPDRMFTAGNPAASIPATVMTPAFANGVQEELCNVIEGAGITLDPEDDTQLDQAIDAKIAASTSAATTTAQGIVELATDAETIAGTDTERAVTPAGLAAALGAGGNIEEGYIDGGSVIPAITDGAALAVVEDGTNDLTRNALSYPGVVKDTHGFFNFRAPSNWDGGTIRAKVLCKGTTGCSAGDDIRFYLACAAVAPGENLDVALGAAVTMDGDVVDAGKLIETTASAAMTPSGTPAAGELLRFRLSRDYDYGAQPMTESAELVGIALQFGITGNTAAWA